jgi:hypothetical protein
LAVAKKQKITFTQSDIIVDTTAVASRSFAKDFKKKYTDAAFVYENKTPEKNAWDRFKEWLAGVFRRMFSFTNNESSMNFVAVLLKVVAVLIIVFVIYMIVKAVMNKEGKWIFGRSSDKKLILYTDIEKNLRLADFEKLIQDALLSGEKRLSIRYYYLWLLKKMSEKQLIDWDVEKTNSDYLSEIKSHGLKEQFSYLSYLYNYIWYGEFDLDDDTFAKAKTAFDGAIKSIGNG